MCLKPVEIKLDLPPASDKHLTIDQGTATNPASLQVVAGNPGVSARG
ncbi:Myosin type-2 heavy chain 1 [Venturia inaequalis]|nr:Myosin type-2 heavy chain 1 [Venturia inaequalis]